MCFYSFIPRTVGLRWICRYRMHSHPQGPSADPTICPKNAPLGEFSNNTAHSLGWFGLWTFEDYFPKDGTCTTTPNFVSSATLDSVLVLPENCRYYL